jgi:RNA polymerase sigma-70 factor (ECF subfamily)
MEDNLIIDLYWARDPRAIAESEQKYGAFCGMLARNILTIPQDAEECVNDTWHRAWETIPPQRPGSLRAYLGRLVRNLAIDRWRRNTAQKRGEGMALMLSELEGCVPGGVLPEQALEGKELTLLLERWLDGLSGEERAIFLRRYWYGTAVQELAGQWGCTPSRMAQRLFRLRKKLRTYLEEQGVAL